MIDATRLGTDQCRWWTKEFGDNLWTKGCHMRLTYHAVALRPEAGLPVSVRRFKAAADVACMEDSALVLPAAAGMAITGVENGRPRPLRSEDGCGRWSATLRKGAPASEPEV